MTWYQLIDFPNLTCSDDPFYLAPFSIEGNGVTNYLALNTCTIHSMNAFLNVSLQISKDVLRKTYAMPLTGKSN